MIEVLKQMVEALENSVDLVIEDAYHAEQIYANVPTRQARVGGLKLLADEHQKAIQLGKQAIAQLALDAKAENARELGLDYSQRTWVGLTDEEVFEICNSNYNRDNELVQMIEAKLKEKNT